MSDHPLRRLPSIDSLLSDEAATSLVASYGHEATVSALRKAADRARERVRTGADAPTTPELVRVAAADLHGRLSGGLERVINATGVIVHTNLGRAPLSNAALKAVEAVSRGYSSLEYDLTEGRRGHRSDHVEGLICELTGAESALVVNNNAGALLLALSGMACGRPVVVSRGQLVEIGGGFRIPDVMAQSGARLVEVGTTNRTHLRDYQRALQSEPDAALILRAHHSNYRIVGFHTEPSLEQLVGLAANAGFPVLDDLGSGALLDTARYGLRHEPTVQESVEAGVGIVCFSGDKLLGGPQSGILVGHSSLVDPLKSHPLARALRADKMCLAALQATLKHYLRDQATDCMPVWQFISAGQAGLRSRAASWRATLSARGVEAELVEAESTVGGGSLPGETLPTTLLSVVDENPDRLATRLRAGIPAVVGRIVDDRLAFDPRTVLPQDDDQLVEQIAQAAGEGTE